MRLVKILSELKIDWLTSIAYDCIIEISKVHIQTGELKRDRKTTISNHQRGR